MRNYIIGFCSFIGILFFIAFVTANGYEDEYDKKCADEIEKVDNFLGSYESSVESEMEEPQESVYGSEESPEADSKAVITSQLYDISAIEIPKATEAFPEQILVREGYTTSYNNKTLCPNWVAWKLTREHTDGPYLKTGVPYYSDDGSVIGVGKITPETLKNNYFIDLVAEKPRQEHSDWGERPSDIDHGHMCPAGDSKWDKAAMNQSYLLTNMCPQNNSLNSGGWRKLEEKCRKWAQKYGEIYIVAGPIFYDGVKNTFGANKIAVPDAFFKVVLCMLGNPKAIGFIYENDFSSQSMNNKCCTVDHVEEVTGFDFFYNLPDDVENAVESMSNINAW